MVAFATASAATSNRVSVEWTYRLAMLRTVWPCDPTTVTIVIDSAWSRSPTRSQVPLTNRRLSVPRFLLMPKGQDIHGISGRNVAVERHIAGVPEANYQFAKLRHLWNPPTNGRVGRQQPDVPCDSLAGTPSGLPVPFGQKPPTAF